MKKNFLLIMLFCAVTAGLIIPYLAYAFSISVYVKINSDVTGASCIHSWNIDPREFRQVECYADAWDMNDMSCVDNYDEIIDSVASGTISRALSWDKSSGHLYYVVGCTNVTTSDGQHEVFDDDYAYAP